MALKSANQQGNTLIEFMVAALVGGDGFSYCRDCLFV